LRPARAAVCASAVPQAPAPTIAIVSMAMRPASLACDLRQET
jgi:hypothetical protein